MAEKTIQILLPGKISIVRDYVNQDIKIDAEEYSIYYSNILFPYCPHWDIRINCKYGKNLGNCWRLGSFDNIEDSFDFTLEVFSEYGERLAEKSCVIEILKKGRYPEYKLMCIGDSMTQGELYLQQTVRKLGGIKTLGTRSRNHVVKHEGRGGWRCDSYFKMKGDESGFSPFLFPVGYGAEEYFGCCEFWEAVSDPEKIGTYRCVGYEPREIKNGMYCYRNKMLCRYENGEYTEIDKDPEFEFDFSKYLALYGIEKPDAVSLLFGANDLQLCKYEDLEKELTSYMEYLKKLIAEIHRCDKNIKVIVNMPICGGDQYSWGTQLGCEGTVKQYNFCMKSAGAAILEAFDGRESENIYVCPMLAVLDPETGFPYTEVKCNMYSEKTDTRITNWVHPSEIGYKMMGDALAGVVMSIREK